MNKVPNEGRGFELGLDFYDPVNIFKVMSSRSIYLTTFYWTGLVF